MPHPLAILHLSQVNKMPHPLKMHPISQIPKNNQHFESYPYNTSPNSHQQISSPSNSSPNMPLGIQMGSSGVQLNDQELETPQVFTQGDLEAINLNEEVRG